MIEYTWEDQNKVGQRRFPKMGGTPKSSIYRLIFHYKPSIFEDPPSMETSKQMGVPPNHRKFDSFSIETHGFGDPPF